MDNQNSGNVFSLWFEKILLSTLEKYFERFIELAEDRERKPAFIKQKSVSKYYEGVTPDTLKKYEALGLKRCEPVTGGNVYYSIKELDRFMLEHQN